MHIYSISIGNATASGLFFQDVTHIGDLERVLGIDNVLFGRFNTEFAIL